MIQLVKGGEHMLKKSRIPYAISFILLLLTEIAIALFVRDRFIRPYFGDVLVTILLCCLYRTILPQGTPALPLYVFGFAVLVEIAQYVNVVKLLGWEHNAFLSTLIGTSFSMIDILCYGVGCLVFWLIETIVIFCWYRRHNHACYQKEVDL